MGNIELSAQEIRQMAEKALQKQKGTKADHAEFAGIFLHQLFSRKEIYGKMTERLLTKARKARLQPIDEPKFMRGRDWRDGDVPYDTQRIECFYKKSTVYKATGGEGGERDLLIQLCIAAGLSVDETNSLLLAAGEPMLYILDPVDAAAMFYLRKFREEEEKGVIPKSSEEKLSLVKREMNPVLQQWDGPRAYAPITISLDLKRSQGKELAERIREFLWDGDEEERAFVACLLEQMTEGEVLHGPDEMDRLEGLLASISGKKAVFNKQKRKKVVFTEEEKERFGLEERGRKNKEGEKGSPQKKWKANLPSGDSRGENKGCRYMVWDPEKLVLQYFSEKGYSHPAFAKPLGESIDEDLERAISRLENCFHLDRKASGGLTRALSDFLREKMATAKSFSDFVNFGNTENGGTIFAQICYGFLRKTKEYLEHPERYMKNLHPSRKNLRLHRAFPASVDEEKGGREGEVARSTLLKYVKSIMGMYFEGDNNWTPMVAEQAGSGTRTIPAQINNGREKTDLDAYAPNGSLYEYELCTKKSMIAYALATGNEEDLGNYLQLAGYWTTDWVQWIEKGTGKPEALEMLDPVDYLCLYAYACRWRYLEAWKEDAKNQQAFQTAALRLEIARGADFPFVVLLLDIGKAILEEFDNTGASRMLAGDRKYLIQNLLIFSPEGI